MKADLSDILNRRIGRLVVLEYAGQPSGGHAYLCACDCGKRISVPRNKLVGSYKRSCGCLMRENKKKIADSSKAFFGFGNYNSSTK